MRLRRKGETEEEGEDHGGRGRPRRKTEDGEGVAEEVAKLRAAGKK